MTHAEATTSVVATTCKLQPDGSDQVTQSTQKKLVDKPAKPHPDFLLFAHASGRWAEKGMVNEFIYAKRAAVNSGEDWPID